MFLWSKTVFLFICPLQVVTEGSPITFCENMKYVRISQFETLCSILYMLRHLGGSVAPVAGSMKYASQDTAGNVFSTYVLNHFYKK